MLTSAEIIHEQIITNISGQDQLQQVGIDLEIIGVSEVIGVGIIPKKGKTILPAYKELDPSGSDIMKRINGIDKGWFLHPGYYQIKLKQGCNVPSNRSLLLVQRSSLCRAGSIICSGVYDPGFITENIGSSLLINRPIFIEYEARVCQAIVFPTEEVANLYDGQYQRDKQREE